MTRKFCKKCGHEKPSTEFYKRGKGITAHCKECIKAGNRSYHAANKQKVYLKQKEYREKNRDKIAAKNKKYGDEHRESLNHWARQYRLERADRLASEKRKKYADNSEPFKEAGRKWRKNNPHLNAEYTRRYEAVKRNAVPIWADFDRIRLIYKACRKISRRTGIPHHVDHIVPLQSDTVCGLHVHHNLAIVPAKVNISKSNRYWPGKFDDAGS